MILLKILDHDLHRARRGVEAVPLIMETPARPNFLPAVVSSSQGKFLVSRKLTKDSKLRSGVFKYDSDRLDDLIGEMFEACYALSRDEGWPNIFSEKRPLHAAFDYVQKNAGMASQPHLCLVPAGKPVSVIQKLAGKDLVDGLFKKVCRIQPCKVPFPVVCSRPDFVGMYTQFMGGRSSIILHNVKNGMAFCPPAGGD